MHAFSSDGGSTMIRVLNGVALDSGVWTRSVGRDQHGHHIDRQHAGIVSAWDANVRCVILHSKFLIDEDKLTATFSQKSLVESLYWLERGFSLGSASRWWVSQLWFKSPFLNRLCKKNMSYPSHQCCYTDGKFLIAHFVAIRVRKWRVYFGAVTMTL